ncbi:cyclic lactone autoinducer peptide [Anaerosolibacter carboniphilus]|uniref:Cyclic lactone autoinducer peptide n=1 Tax=Anaerosolibacter carboniphilus TaxID=1417629 RepID=A0A841L491_9FIRM|nr:cyclic lactone autoinducer peptide [Anaerosolibacter carboniphilus]MBB6217145.1 cyclic lactone autoinducer peptide [Anaerosolibacter carboniphilus]
MMNFIKSNSLKILTLFALFVGTASASSATLMLSHQPKCPEELLK